MKLTTPKENDDVVSGYLDGFSDTRDELPDSLQNRSYLYVHGWLNGRDDRIGKPRAFASDLRWSLMEAEYMELNRNV